MTIDSNTYFETQKPDRKKEIRYIAVIDKNSCTSCEACATMCPVDCIYEVVRKGPSQSYHQIDTSRCIGCQLCYLIPTESTEHYKLEICPWNAIDMVHNPNIEKGDPILRPYYAGEEEEDVPWHKLEEYGYQIYLNEEVLIRPYVEDLVNILEWFRVPFWVWGEDNINVLEEPVTEGPFLRYRVTPQGLDMLRAIFVDYPKIYLD